MSEIQKMVGRTFVEVKNLDDRRLVFVAAEGDEFHFYHEQDCCEYVRIADIVGALSSLVNTPLLVAEESSRRATGEEVSESGTWTFYKFATVHGWVDVRWLGSSNGYYSEGVSLAHFDSRVN
jgi:hypothetical protein